MPSGSGDMLLAALDRSRMPAKSHAKQPHYIGATSHQPLPETSKRHAKQPHHSWASSGLVEQPAASYEAT
eukprot:2472201-Alexandrium_andersonii.AAC.1